MNVCSIQGCDRKPRTRGLCSTHHTSERRAGRLPLLRRPSREERFWAKVNKTDTCWNWTAFRSPTGYGQFGTGKNRVELAHRVSYEMHHGPIPEGLVIDHLCRNTSCVNPEHLEAVTSRENTMRGESPAAHAARRNTCGKGHPLEGDNLGFSSEGTRRCRTCDRAASRARNLRKKELRDAS